jgi:hypothetical protein
MTQQLCIWYLDTLVACKQYNTWSSLYVFYLPVYYVGQLFPNWPQNAVSCGGQCGISRALRIHISLQPFSRPVFPLKIFVVKKMLMLYSCCRVHNRFFNVYFISQWSVKLQQLASGSPRSLWMLRSKSHTRNFGKKPLNFTSVQADILCSLF